MNHIISKDISQIAAVHVRGSSVFFFVVDVLSVSLSLAPLCSSKPSRKTANGSLKPFSSEGTSPFAPISWTDNVPIPPNQALRLPCVSDYSVKNRTKIDLKIGLSLPDHQKRIVMHRPPRISSTMGSIQLNQQALDELASLSIDWTTENQLNQALDELAYLSIGWTTENE